MTITSIFEESAFIYAFVRIAFSRPGSRRRAAARLARSDQAAKSLSADRRPESQSLAGVPLRILLTERSAAGGLLKEFLLHGTSSANDSRRRH